jgi:hypothetical protein
MAAGDPVDTHGHTVADAEAQEPTLDASATPGSQEGAYDGLGADDLILAQTAEEVTAQIENVPGGAGS